MYDTPTFVDDFASDDPGRWVQWDGKSAYPPPAGTPGKWLRTLQGRSAPSRVPGDNQDARTEASSGQLQSYEDSALSIGPDGLVITATKGRSAISGLPWVSGVVTQAYGLAIAYGYFEWVAKLPGGRGIWPALYMNNVGGGWLSEFDCLETVGIDSDGQPANGQWWHTAYHCDDNASQAQCWVPGDTTGWHKYGVLKLPDFTSVWYDDMPVQRWPTPIHGDLPSYMIASLAIGGTWPGNPDPGTTTARMLVRRMSSYAAGSWDAGKPIPATPPVPGADAVLTVGRNGTATLALARGMPAGAYAVAMAAPRLVPLALLLTGDAYGGNPVASMTLDGTALQHVEVTAARGGYPQWVNVGMVDPTKPHTVTCAMLADAYGGSPDKDRNLYCTGSVLDGVTTGGAWQSLSGEAFTVRVAAGK